MKSHRVYLDSSRRIWLRPGTFAFRLREIGIRFFSSLLLQLLCALTPTHGLATESASTPGASTPTNGQSLAQRATGCACNDRPCWDRLAMATSTSNTLCALAASLSAAALAAPHNAVAYSRILGLASCLVHTPLSLYDLYEKIHSCAALRNESDLQNISHEGEAAGSGTHHARDTSVANMVRCFAPIGDPVTTALTACFSGVVSGAHVVGSVLTVLSCGPAIASGGITLLTQLGCLASDAHGILESQARLERQCRNRDGYQEYFRACVGNPNNVNNRFLSGCFDPIRGGTNEQRAAQNELRERGTELVVNSSLRYALREYCEADGSRALANDLPRFSTRPPPRCEVDSFVDVLEFRARAECRGDLTPQTYRERQGEEEFRRNQILERRARDFANSPNGLSANQGSPLSNSIVSGPGPQIGIHDTTPPQNLIPLRPRNRIPLRYLTDPDGPLER